MKVSRYLAPVAAISFLATSCGASGEASAQTLH